MMLDQPIDSLPNTSTVTIRRLKSLGIQTYWDLWNYFPFRYEDFSVTSKISQLQEGETVTVIGQIVDSKFQITRTQLRIQKFILQDETGTMELNWYNQPYLLTLLKKGLTVSVAGEVVRFGRKLVMNPKEYEIINSDQLLDRSKPRNPEFTPIKSGLTLGAFSQSLRDEHPFISGFIPRAFWLRGKHTGRLVPVYSETRGLSTRTVREKIFYILNNFCADRSKSCIPEVLSTAIISYNNLIDESSAYQNIHFPDNLEILKKARERISFDELFILQLSSTLIRKEWEKEVVGNRFLMSDTIEKSLDSFISKLPFVLTKAQMRVTNEIRKDLEKEKPMNRLLQGEVGSGKTVVAAIACYLSYLNGYQSLIMAPTEILAQQHYQTITNLFQKLTLDARNLKLDLEARSLRLENQTFPKVCLVTGSTKPIAKRLEKADIIIGTHALIQKNISYKKVGLVIVDEQHRFGVVQRSELKSKGLNPHVLSMTATPIPRTVMLTLYGELDMSVIDEMPIGRLPIKTYFITKHKRNDCYAWVKKQIEELDIQVFIVCPFIEESEIETMKSVKAAKKEVELLQKTVFPEYPLGLIHGKMKSKEKDEVMNGFKDKKYRILVATPVVEVGIDIQNATIMLIEGAERFGLAQLHQLRGRVGRGDKQSYCFLFTETESPEITKRLQFVSKTHNGNILAEKDLELRGAGTIYGTLQHGIMDLKIASLSDYLLIEKTRKAVNYFIGKYELKKFTELEERIKKYKIKQIARD